MRTTDTEHRTLAILITVGMLLGVGLAVASPAQRQPVARVTPAAITTPPATVAPARTPGAQTGTPEQDAHVSESDAGCGALLAAGLPDDLGSGLPHAAHILLANCAKNGGTGLPNGLGHVGENDGKGHGRGHAGDRGRSEEQRGHGRVDRRVGSAAGRHVHGSDRESGGGADGRGGSQGSGGRPDDAGPVPRER